MITIITCYCDCRVHREPLSRKVCLVSLTAELSEGRCSVETSRVNVGLGLVSVIATSLLVRHVNLSDSLSGDYKPSGLFFLLSIPSPVFKTTPLDRLQNQLPSPVTVRIPVLNVPLMISITALTASASHAQPALLLPDGSHFLL